MQLLLATRNAHKTREFAEILGNEFQIRDLTGLTLPAVEETGRSFEANAILKAAAISQHHNALVIADDSGLEVDSLGGAPGIFSARYAGKDATDQANIAKLLRELRGVAERSARFRCVIALADNGKLVRTFEGAIEGQILEEAHGSSGFGYDPVFLPNGCDRSFAEMAPELKNQISHRHKAAAALRDYLL